MAEQQQGPFYVGVDVGTTSVKVCAFDGDGAMVAETIKAYELLHPEPKSAVQLPSDIIEACNAALRQTVRKCPGPVAAIGLSCPMHSVVLYHEEEGFADTIYTWADGRGEDVIHHFGKDLRRELHRLTGTPVHPMSPLVKFRWLRENYPEQIAAATHLYSLKELLVNFWATETALDEQLASATGLYDAVAGEWCDLALRTAAGQTAEEYEREGFTLQLPPVRPATYRLEWRPETARWLGVQGIPLFLGGSDGCLANLGSGITGPGEVAVTIGTSAAVRATHPRGRIDPAHQLFNYQIDAERFAVGGASNNGGKIVEYWQELLRAHFVDIPAFIDAAFTQDEDDSLCFQPYLYGERAPLWDAAATAALTGLRGHHTPAQIARAVLDGVTDNVVAILRALEAATGPTKTIHASGGFTRSPEWMALLAEKSGREVVMAKTPQASAYGAALVARRGLEDSET